VVRIKCAVCPDFDLCLECFSVGVEINPHKSNHAYRVVDNLSFPLYHPEWGVCPPAAGDVHSCACRNAQYPHAQLGWRSGHRLSLRAGLQPQLPAWLPDCPADCPTACTTV
jgi:hypothetical protein